MNKNLNVTIIAACLAVLPVLAIGQSSGEYDPDKVNPKILEKKKRQMKVVGDQVSPPKAIKLPRNSRSKTKNRAKGVVRAVKSKEGS